MMVSIELLRSWAKVRSCVLMSGGIFVCCSIFGCEGKGESSGAVEYIT